MKKSKFKAAVEVCLFVVILFFVFVLGSWGIE